MNNNWDYDVVCTINSNIKVQGKYYTTWRSTDGHIYINDEQQDKEHAYKAVELCQVCQSCPAQDICLEEIRITGKTEY